MSLRRFDDLIRLLCQFFFEKKVHYAIIGGVAILFQGRFRTTEDINVVVKHEMLEIDDFVSFCQIQGLSIEKQEIEIGFREQSHISIFDLPSGIRIDLSGTYTPWDIGVVREAEAFRYEDTVVKIAKPEYLIANKLYKGGDIDLEDAFSAYIQNQDRIDPKLLKTISESLGVDRLLTDFFAKVEEMEKKERE